MDSFRRASYGNRYENWTKRKLNKSRGLFFGMGRKRTGLLQGGASYRFVSISLSGKIIMQTGRTKINKSECGLDVNRCKYLMRSAGCENKANVSVLIYSFL